MSSASDVWISRCPAGDAAAIADVAALVTRVFADEMDLDVRRELEADLAPALTDGGSGALVLAAHAGPLLAGAVVLTRSEERAAAANLSWLAVVPALRHGGIGRALVARALDTCGAEGVAHVTARSFAASSAAPHLFWQAGFRVSALRASAVGSRRCETIAYERRLSPGVPA